MRGIVIVIFNINSGKSTEGWNQIMTLPRKLTLIARDVLSIEPAGAVESLRGQQTHVDAMELPANEEVVLPNVQGNSMEIVAEIAPGGAPVIAMNVLRSPEAEEVTRILFFKERGYRNRARKGPLPSVISLDISRSSTLPDVRSRPPETAPVPLERGETLKLRVFVDRSVVEVFVNGRQCVAARVYPGRDDSLGVSFRSQGQAAQLKSLDAWQMHNIYEEQGARL